jgi:hypothetical protein
MSGDAISVIHIISVISVRQVSTYAAVAYVFIFDALQPRSMDDCKAWNHSAKVTLMRKMTNCLVKL